MVVRQYDGMIRCQYDRTKPVQSEIGPAQGSDKRSFWGRHPKAMNRLADGLGVQLDKEKRAFVETWSKSLSSPN